MPAIFHVTHWKAGSQWIYRILHQCARERIVKPQRGNEQFTRGPVQQGKVYPTLYVTKEEFDSAALPGRWYRFVVIRDLRDTLASAYFSWKFSHPLLSSSLAGARRRLQACSMEEGLLYMIDEWLPGCARIQESWLRSGERLIRYEDLLERDLEILEPLLLDEAGLPVSPERFRAVVLVNRFENVTRGRRRGQEDVAAHERKAVPGDWRNHFTKRVNEVMKAQYGELLMATGYERDVGW